MTQPTPTMQGQYAGFASRAIGLIIDQVLIYLTVVTVTWLSTSALALFGIDIQNCPPPSGAGFVNFLFGSVCAISRTLILLTAALAPGLYFIIMWWLGGQTIGDGVVGGRVMQTTGHGLSLLRAALRLFGYFVCVISLGIGFLWVLIDSRRQGWHDKIANTVVVYAWEARQDDDFVRRMKFRLRNRRPRNAA